MTNVRMKNVPNFITSLRIVGTMVLFFVDPFHASFYVLYTLCGLTDVLDGYVARKYNVVSDLGSRLDSIADLMYYAMMIFKLLPVLIELLPMYVWYMFFGVVFVRALSYVIAAVRYRRLASRHTYMNKVSGFLAFLVPYFLDEGIVAGYCTFLGVVVSAATLEELLMHIFHKEYRSDMKTIFCK